MSLLEKPSIYNAPSVYNQGGGDGSFTVDMGGGVKQVFTLPPYLTPVEYIDNSNYTAGRLNIIGSRQINAAADASQYYVKLVVQANKNKWGNYVVDAFILTQGLKVGGTSSDTRFSFTKSIGRITANIGNASTSISNLELDQKLFIEYDAATINLVVKSSNGVIGSATGSGSYPTVNYGQFSVFNNFADSPNYIFKGRFFYSYVKKGDEVEALFVPARRKDGSNTQPYIVECVSGSVALNCSTDSTTTGIEFGPDIDLSDIENYFQ